VNIDNFLLNYRYTKNIGVMKAKLDSAPFTSREIFVKHVEYAAQFDDHLGELDLVGGRMSSIQYFGLDFILPAVALFLLAVTFAFMLFWKCLSFISRIIFTAAVKGFAKSKKIV
jgi:hypothetical protein